MRKLGASSLHVLFPAGRDREFLAAAGLMPRLDCQFHWRNEGYGSFDDFLAGFTAEKRKKLKRERRRVAEAGIECRTLHGGELDEAMIDTVYRLHAITFARYGHAPYLNRDFFSRHRPHAAGCARDRARRHSRANRLPVRFRCEGGTRSMAATGARAANIHSLHFELCYYRGIEYCIRERLTRFEPGTQGEHKLLRGFLPTPVWSMHEIADARFGAAIGDWLRARAQGTARMAATKPLSTCPSGAMTSRLGSIPMSGIAWLPED